jgi:hypothetical protein
MKSNFTKLHWPLSSRLKCEDVRVFHHVLSPIAFLTLPEAKANRPLPSPPKPDLSLVASPQRVASRPWLSDVSVPDIAGEI